MLDTAGQEKLSFNAIAGQITKLTKKGGGSLQTLFRKGTASMKLWNMEKDMFTQDELDASKKLHGMTENYKRQREHDGTHSRPQKQRRFDSTPTHAEDSEEMLPPRRAKISSRLAGTTATLNSKPKGRAGPRKLMDKSVIVETCKNALIRAYMSREEGDVSDYTSEPSAVSVAVTVPDSEDEAPPDHRRPQRSDDRAAQPATPAAHLVSLFACEHCDDVYSDKTALCQHKSLHAATTSSQVEGTAVCNIDSCNAVFHSAQDFEQHKQNHEELREYRANDIIEPTAKAGIGSKHYQNVTRGEKDIINMMGCKDKATTKFLSDAGLDARDNVTLQVNIYEQELVDLLHIAFDPGRIDDDQALLSFEDYLGTPENELQLLEFVMAIVGCAVTHWALKSIPQGETNIGLLREVRKFLRTKSQSLEDNVIEKATSTYLTKDVRPRIEKTAGALAGKLLHLLRHFVPSLEQNKIQSPTANRSEDRQAAENEAEDEDEDEDGAEDEAEDEGPDTDLQSSTPPQSPNVIMLTFRAPFDINQHVARQKFDNQEIKPSRLSQVLSRATGADASRILIALMPTVYGFYRKELLRDDPWEPKKVIVKADVHLHRKGRK